MKKINLESVNCDLCGSTHFTLFSTMRADEGWNFAPSSFSYVRCVKCKLLFLNPRPDIQALNQYYEEETVQTDELVKGHVSSYYHNYIFGEKYHIENARNELNRIRKFKSSGRILEIGCAAGFFLNEAKNLGWEVFGVEPSKNFAKYARDNFNIDVINNTLIDGDFPNNYFDAVVHFDLISHLGSPSKIFDVIYKILKPGGLHYFKTGNKGELTKKSQGEIGEAWGVPEHLFHFSRDNLKMLLEKHNFETNKIIISANIEKIIFKRKKHSENHINPVNKSPSIKNKKKNNFFKKILHSKIFFERYKRIRESRVLWETLGKVIAKIYSPISSNVWIISFKK
tara:strand:+ start:3230 stop:4249 length:1020 start_codon:yes stop_codon:yes gene_type:complete